MIADGGGLANAALRPIEGAEEIARYVVDLASRAASNVTILEHTVNGQPGLVAQQDGVTVTVFVFAVTGQGSRISCPCATPRNSVPGRRAHLRRGC